LAIYRREVTKKIFSLEIDHVFSKTMTAESVGEDLSFETNLSLTTLDVENMIYKGEGNANIVIALPHVSQ